MRGKKKNKNKALIAICFIVTMLGITLGFAANSRNLDITNIGANVNPEAVDLDVIFDNDQVASNNIATVKGVGTGADPTEPGATITNPSVAGVAPVISGFTSKFTEKGQNVEYKFYVYNQSPYKAFLEKAQFTIETGEHKTCTAISAGTANETNIANACKDITLSLIVDGNTILSTGSSTFTTHSIDVNTWKEITVKIAYDGNDYPLPDGDMKVSFDAIRLFYTTIEQ